MALISILPNGTTSGNPNPMGNKNPPKRSETIGWNYQVSARLRKWLYSIPVDSLTGHGLAFTLTVRDCPDTSDDWAKLRDVFIKRLFRSGCIRLQWLTEWQRRGVPHLHGIAYFEKPYNPDLLIRNWVDVAGSSYGSAKWSQDCKPITNVLGWLDYLSKHAARSASHYQRSPENVPEGWAKTGRMWGSRGEWEIREPMRFEIDQEGFYHFRRIAKGIYHSNVRLRLQQALKHGKKQGFTYKEIRENNRSQFKQFTMSKKALQTSDPNMGRMMGTSDWLDQEQSIQIINWLGSQGFHVQQS